MFSFAIQRGATPLCTWDADTGHASFHNRAVQQDGLLVIEESDKFALVVYEPLEGIDFRITIGDVPLGDIVPTPDDSGGMALGDRIVWRELTYFESARGLTKVLLERQPEDSVHDQWTPVLSINVYVLPSKLGEDRYESMADEMQKVSRSLLVDLYGKSRRTHDLRMSKEGNAIRSHDDELHSIESALDSLGPLLLSIGQRPASRVKTVPIRSKYWGETRLTQAMISWLSRRGESPLLADRPLSIIKSRKVESFDIPEHRVVKAFLAIVIRRASYCLKVVKGHITAINSEQHLRHIRLGNGPTIFESIDLPRIRRLELAVLRAEQSLRLATAMCNLPFLRGVQPQLVVAHEGAFQRNTEYRVLLEIIRHFLLTNAMWYQGDERSEVTKLTSRLFEQWCYLRIVDGFRAGGLELREWDDALRQNLKTRFILDFDRGLIFEGELGAGLRLRFRYEPWILSRESAERACETLCRGASGEVAWCPDIMIECLKLHDGNWVPVYGVVLDCKYTSAIRTHHWSGTEKYLEIRSTRTHRQLVRQLWLVAPSAQRSIRSEDPAITFDDDGPTCESDEAVRFQLSVTPGSDDGTATLHLFAAGLMAYMRRHFGSMPIE